MDKPSLESVLACPQLPSLPAVAMKVLELTQHADVKFDELASVIQNDQALAAKVLRTVNSSYYGLSKPCANIKQAIAFLGLNAVKSLVLGFSLAQSIDGGGESDVTFDFIDYWRRGVYAAACARQIAMRSKRCDPDEAFLAALMQDIGMVALHRAMGDFYLMIMDLAEGDHRLLPAQEMKSLEYDHAIVGGEIARRWRLPTQLVQAISHHHHSGSADEEWTGIAQTVELASVFAAAIGRNQPPDSMTGFERLGREWLALHPSQCRVLLDAVVADARQISRLFGLDTGDQPDVAALMFRAKEALTEHRSHTQLEKELLEGTYLALEEQNQLDPVTRVGSSEAFEGAYTTRFATSRKNDRPFGLLILRFEGINEKARPAVSDFSNTALVDLALRLRKAAGEDRVVYKLPDATFALILPSEERLTVATFAETIRRTVSSDLIMLQGLPMKPMCSVGVAVYESLTAEVFTDPTAMRKAASDAVAAAKAAGSDCVRVFTPRRTAQKT